MHSLLPHATTLCRAVLCHIVPCCVVQGVPSPHLELRAFRRSVHRQGPQGGTPNLVYNIGEWLLLLLLYACHFGYRRRCCVPELMHTCETQGLSRINAVILLLVPHLWTELPFCIMKLVSNYAILILLLLLAAVLAELLVALPVDTVPTVITIVLIVLVS
jgi:hypothetical protein